MAAAQTLIIGPPIALGLILGIYETIVVHRDVDQAFQKSIHGTAAIITTIIGTFASMNAAFVLSIIPALQTITFVGTPLGLQVAIGLITAIRIHGQAQAKAAKGISGIHGGETWFHSILIGALVVAAPYVYPVIEPQVPAWLKF